MTDRYHAIPETPPSLRLEFAAAWATLAGETVGRNRLRQVDRIEREGTGYYVKFFHRPTLNDILRNLCTAPRALSQGHREWRLAGSLEQAGIRAISPVAYGHRLFLGWERRSLFISREQEGPTLGRVLRTGAVPGERITAAFITLFHRLVDAGIFLPDLSLEHILVAPNGDLVLLDLHNGRVYRRLSVNRAGRMLGRVWAGALDTLPATSGLRLAARALRGRYDRRGRRLALAEAAVRGTRWARREQRKREGSDG